MRCNLRIKVKQKSSLIDFSNRIDEMIRTKNSKEAFNIINRLTIMHPTNRDGGIFNCYTDTQNNLIVDSNQVNANCLAQLQKISGKGKQPLKIDEI